jgi:hypothetical protein
VIETENRAFEAITRVFGTIQFYRSHFASGHEGVREVDRAIETLRASAHAYGTDAVLVEGVADALHKWMHRGG